MPHLDKSGREIVAGSYIVYGFHNSFGVGMRYAKVLGIDTKPRLRNNRTHLATWPEVIVQGVDDSYEEPRRHKNTTRLKFLQNILVVTPDQVPAKVRELLDA